MIYPSPQTERVNSMQENPDAYGKVQYHLAGFWVSVCTIFLADCYYSLKVMVPKEIINISVLGDHKNKDDYPTFNMHLALPQPGICTKFQLDTFYSLGAMALRVIFYLFALMCNDPPTQASGVIPDKCLYQFSS